jgi:hypothetical protein
MLSVQGYAHEVCACSGEHLEPCLCVTLARCACAMSTEEKLLRVLTRWHWSTGKDVEGTGHGLVCWWDGREGKAVPMLN